MDPEVEVEVEVEAEVDSVDEDAVEAVVDQDQLVKTWITKMVVVAEAEDGPGVMEGLQMIDDDATEMMA